MHIMKKLTMSMYLGVLLMLVCLLASCGGRPAITMEDNGLDEFGSSDRVILIVLDGFASRYLNYLDQDSSLYQLLQYATYDLDGQTIYPSHTCNAHTSLMTGTYPDQHGLIGNVYYDQNERISQKNISADLIDQKTLFEIAGEHGKKTAIVSGKKNMLTLFEKGCDIQATMSAHPDYIGEALQLDDSENNDQYYDYHLKTTSWVFEALKSVLTEEKPDFTLVNIQSADSIGHRFGPDSFEVAQAVKLIDQEIGKLFSYMKKSDILSDTAVMILADHGMSPVSKAIPINVLMNNNFDQAAVVVDGRNAYIWLNGDDAAAVTTFFEAQEGVARITSKGSPEAQALRVDCERCPDLILDSEPGYLFIPEALLWMYQGMHGTTEDSDMNIPMIFFGSGIPQNQEMADAKIVDLAALTCKLMGLTADGFDGTVPRLTAPGAEAVDFFTGQGD